MQTITVYKANVENLFAIKTLADSHRMEFGFIPRAKLEEIIVAGRMLVVKIDGEVIGFVTYRHRKKDAQTTLSEICIAQQWQRQGVGHKLMLALYSECREHRRTHIQLKCPVDLPANGFYQHLGFQHYATEPGRVRALNVWRKYLSS